MTTLIGPMFDAGVALTRLDERIARSPVGDGWIERTHFTDACASLLIYGELVHLEDLVLHDATRDIRTSTHELTIARDVLRTRRRALLVKSLDWALSTEGIQTLRQTQALPGPLDGPDSAARDRRVELEQLDGSRHGFRSQGKRILELSRRRSSAKYRGISHLIVLRTTAVGVGMAGLCNRSARG